MNRFYYYIRSCYYNTRCSNHLLAVDMGVACRCMCGWKNGKRCRDSNPLKYCGVISTLFGCFFWIPSLHGTLTFLNVTCVYSLDTITSKVYINA